MARKKKQLVELVMRCPFCKGTKQTRYLFESAKKQLCLYCDGTGEYRKIIDNVLEVKIL